MATTIRVRKVFSSSMEEKPYSIRIGMFQTWLSENDLIIVIEQAKEALPKKVQLPFSKQSMPEGEMKVMIPVV